MTKAEYEGKLEWYIHRLFFQNGYHQPVTQAAMDDWMQLYYIDLGL